MEAKNLASETKLKQKIQFFSFRATIPKTIFDRPEIIEVRARTARKSKWFRAEKRRGTVKLFKGEGPQIALWRERESEKRKLSQRYVYE